MVGRDAVVGKGGIFDVENRVFTENQLLRDMVVGYQRTDQIGDSAVVRRVNQITALVMQQAQMAGEYVAARAGIKDRSVGRIETRVLRDIAGKHVARNTGGTGD